MNDGEITIVRAANEPSVVTKIRTALAAFLQKHRTSEAQSLRGEEGEKNFALLAKKTNKTIRLSRLLLASNVCFTEYDHFHGNVSDFCVRLADRKTFHIQN